MLISDRANIHSMQFKEQLGEPFILKIPMVSFSHGITKITNQQELAEALEILFEISDSAAQKIHTTEYDWRIVS